LGNMNFYERREQIKNAIAAGEWPAVAESEILAWIAYMENIEADLLYKGGALVRMIDRVVEVQAAAARWVMYDQSQETLPDHGRWVMVVLSGHREPVAALCLLHIDSDHAMYWASTDKDWSVSRGDRWAYLPQPPEPAND